MGVKTHHLVARCSIPVLCVVFLAALLSLGACASKDDGPSKPADVGTPTSVPTDTIIDSAEWGSYFEALGDDEELAFAQGCVQNPPISLHLTWLSVSGERTRIYNDPSTIIAAFNALAVLDVEGKSSTVTCDDDSVYTFIAADGSEHHFSFNSGNASIGRDYYMLSNTAAFSQFEHRLRSEDDEGYGNVSQGQYALLEEGTTWGQVYELLGEPLAFEHNDEYTAITVTYAAWDGLAAVLDLKSPDGEPNHYQLVSKSLQEASAMG